MKHRFSILLLSLLVSFASVPVSAQREFCILNNLTGFDSSQLADEVSALQEAAQILRGVPQRPLTGDELQEVRFVEGMNPGDNYRNSDQEVQNFYEKKLENSAKVIDAEIQYRRAKQTALSLDIATISRLGGKRLKTLGLKIGIPIRVDHAHLTDVIDGLRFAHGQEQTYDNEEIAEYLAYEAVYTEWLAGYKNRDDSPSWQQRNKQLEELQNSLREKMPSKLWRAPNLIADRILHGCCHAGCGKCYFGAVKNLRPRFNPVLAQQTELPLYKALQLVRPFISAIDSANPDWLPGKNRNFR